MSGDHTILYQGFFFFFCPDMTFFLDKAPLHETENLVWIFLLKTYSFFFLGEIFPQVLSVQSLC